MTEREVTAIMKRADEVMRLGKEKINQQAAQIEKLTSERDLFSQEAEHWRTLAYKLAQPRELQPPVAPPAPMAANPGGWQCM